MATITAFASEAVGQLDDEAYYYIGLGYQDSSGPQLWMKSCLPQTCTAYKRQYMLVGYILLSCHRGHRNFRLLRRRGCRTCRRCR